VRRLIFTVVLFITAIAYAGDKGLIEVRAEVDTAVITIGDQIHYSIIIDRKKDLRVVRPGEGLNLGMFEIKQYNFPNPVEKDGRIIERFNFTISVYDTGHYAIPAFPLAYFPQDTSSKYQIIEAPAINIYVKSVLSGAEARTLKDIKNPLEIPFNYKFWISVFIIVLLVLVAAYLVYYLLKKRKERGYIFTPPPPPPPAHQVALKGLQELFASNLLEEGAVKEFFSRLSDIIRVYLENRYYILALEQTTAEIMASVKSLIEDEGLNLDLNKLLSLSDLVKFAKQFPQAAEIEHSKMTALNFVEETKLVYEAEEGNKLEEAGVTAEEEAPKMLTDGLEK